MGERLHQVSTPDRRIQGKIRRNLARVGLAGVILGTGTGVAACDLIPGFLQGKATPVPSGNIGEKSPTPTLTPFSTENPTVTLPPSLFPTPEITPTPTLSPTESPTSSPTPDATSIPIEKVPTSETAKRFGNLNLWPSGIAPGYFLSEQYPQIIAKIRSGDSLLIATIIGDKNKKLQKTEAGTSSFNGKDINLYNYKNLIIWYKIGPKTVLRENDSTSADTSTQLGVGIDVIDKALFVGEDLTAISTSVSPTGNLVATNAQGKENAATFKQINGYVGQPVSYDKKFILFPSVIILPYKSN